MPSSRGRREGEQREAVGARLGVDGAEGWQGRARPQVGADGTPAVQVTPSCSLLLPPWSLGLVETAVAGPGSPARPAVIKSGREMKTFFPPCKKRKSFNKEKAPMMHLQALYKPQ